MRKISTLFAKDPGDLSKVVNVLNIENKWVFDGEAIATRKFEKFEKHTLVKHGAEILDFVSLDFDALQNFLVENDIEGIVFHHISDGRMCKLRKRDFGMKRLVLANSDAL